MNRLVTWARLGNKSKDQPPQPNLKPPTGPSLPEGGQEKEKVAEVAEVADPAPCRDELDHRSADVGQSNDVVAPKEGAVIEASASRLSIHCVGSAHDIPSPAARPDVPNSSSDPPAKQSPCRPPRLKHSRSFFSTLAIAKKFRIKKRNRVPLDRAPDNSVPALPDLSRRLTHRPKPVPIRLSDDIASKERRKEALRARGLLPSMDLSALEADEDRRIDALHKKSTSLSSSDNTHSYANDIAHAWRIRNSRWLSESLPNLETSRDPMTEDTSSLSEGLLALVTVDADDPASIPLLGSPSISKFLTLGSDCSPSQSPKAASTREFIGHEDSPLVNSASPTSPEGLVLPLSCLEDSPTIPFRGVLEDVKITSTQSAPSSPASSERSPSLHPQISEKPQASSPSLPSQRSLSPSHQQEDSQTPGSLAQSPSELRTESSSKPLPTEPQPELLDITVTAQAQRSVPDLSPLLLFPIVSDTLLASPTTPTLSPSVCHSPSEASDSTPTGDNGVLIASPTSDVMLIRGQPPDITSFSAKKGEGVVVTEEVILEGSEPFPDEDDLDPFAASPSSPSLPTVITTPPSSVPRIRSSTLGPPPSAAKPVPLTGLRRTITSSLFRRPRARTTMSHLSPTDLSPPASPLEVTVHNRSTIYEEALRIDDDEVRRLSELAFLT